jgi:ABC-type transporter Mla MlaB component
LRTSVPRKPHGGPGDFPKHNISWQVHYKDCFMTVPHAHTPSSSVPVRVAPAIGLAIAEGKDIPFRPLTISADLGHAGAGAARVAHRGELYLSGSAQFVAALVPLRGASPHPVGGRPSTELVIDLAALSFLDSSGLTALSTGKEALQAAGWSVQVSDPVGQVRWFMELVGNLGLLPANLRREP